MKNSEYWEKRIANNTWSIYNSLEEKNRGLLEMYQEASLSISDELYRVAEKMQTSTPRVSDMHKLNRLSNLQKNMENTIRELGESVETFGKEKMMEGFSDTYSNVMVEVGATEFDQVPEKVMKEMLDRPWEGSNFSTRLWKNTQVLSTNLNDIITNGLTQGKTVTEMAIQLNNAMSAGFNVSHRLVRTETMHYLNESSFKGYVDAGCEEVQLWAATDERTCKVCGTKHGNIYKIKDRPILPLHANCRCTYLPVIDEEEAKKDHDKAKEDTNKEDNIKEANTINDVRDFSELKKYLKTKLDINNVTDEILELDFNAIKETCTAMEETFNEFPQLKGFVKELYTSKSGIMSCSPEDSNFNGVRISFNPNYYKDIKKLKKVYDEDVSTGFHPRGTTYAISGVHELGHAVEAILVKKRNLDYNSTRATYWNDCIISKEIVSEAAKKAKKTLVGNGKKNFELKNSISGYALSDSSECMAEAFSDYFTNKENASILSIEIMKIIKEMM